MSANAYALQPEEKVWRLLMSRQRLVPSMYEISSAYLQQADLVLCRSGAQFRVNYIE